GALLHRRQTPEELRAEHLAGAGADAARELIEHALALREIDEVFRSDHFARDVAHASELVHETELEGVLAGPEQSREDFLRLLQRLAAPFAHALDELL